MKKHFLIFILALSPLFSFEQTLDRKVISSTGGFYSNATGSLSFTLGETATQTYSAGGQILTQGFQQPNELNINLKAFLQGYYVGSGLMTNTLFNQGEYASPLNVTDSVTVSLRLSTPPYTNLFETKQVINENGTIAIKGLGVVGTSYFIVITHRNSLETWSSNPVLLSDITNYDFSTAAGMAYGSNQIEVETGIWALYTGDLNQDGSIDALDYLDLDVDITAGSSGYLSSDLNGDGSTDVLDYLILDPNIVAGVGVAMP